MNPAEIQPPKAAPPPPNATTGINKKQTKILATWNLYM